MSHETRGLSVVEQLQQLKSLPGDLVAVMVALLLFDGIVALAPSGTPLRALLGLGLVAFVPGYLLLAILVPGEAIRADTVVWREAVSGGRTAVLDGFERAALSVGCSIVMLPIFALLLAGAGLAYTEGVLLVGLNVVLFVGLIAATYRRLQIPQNERFSITIHRRVFATTAEQLRERTALGVVNLLLVLAVVLAASTMAYALVAPQDGEHSSSLSVLTSNGTEAITGNYPETLNATDSGELLLSVTNNEDERTSYTVVAELQRVDLSGDSVSVIEESELARFEPTLNPGNEWRHDHTFSPSMSGEDLRLQYYLYRGDAPSDAEASSAYRTVYLWVSVEQG